MKRLSICLSFLLAALPLSAQMSMQMKKPPASPKAVASMDFSGKTITIDYSSPRVRGREGHIFNKGGLVSHDRTYPIWRAGANAATTLHTAADISLGDLNVPAGTYTLFVDISNPAQWTLVVSKKTGEWGLTYDRSDDLGRVPMHMSKPPKMVEDLTYTIKREGNHKGMLTLEWENERASVPIVVH